MHVTRQYRAYSFGELIDSCHFGLVYRRELILSRRVCLDGHDDVNYYDRIDYIVITTIRRREGTAGVCSSQPFFRRRRLLRHLLSRSLLLLSSERRSVEASAFSPFSANSFTIERRRTRSYAMC